ncbi:hypothetical protein HN51_059428, partial [Arachis hypogaea]
TVALVGESESGKSTVIALLQRFYDPDSSHSTLDGKDIQTLQVKWLRQQGVMVSIEEIGNFVAGGISSDGSCASRQPGAEVVDFAHRG